MTVVVIGDIVTDTLAAYSGQFAVGSDTPACITVTGGGSAANTAVWLASLAMPVRLVGAVGTDRQGDERLAELSAAGVECLVRRTTEAATGAIVVLSTTGERTMLSDRGANSHFTTGDVAVALPGVRHLHLSGYTLFDERTRQVGLRALADARARGATTSVDASSAAPLRQIGGATFLSWLRAPDLLFANADEAAALLNETGPAEDLAASLTAVAPRVVVKRGAEGSIWADVNGVVTAPAVSAVMVDPTGAGDAFAAGVLEAWLTGAAPDAALAAGARLGALAVSSPGGRPAAAGRTCTKQVTAPHRSPRVPGGR